MRVSRNVPRISICCMRSNFFIARSVEGERSIAEALLTTMSMAPKRSTVSATARCTSSSWRTSPTTASAWPPACSISSAAVWMVPSSRGWGWSVFASSVTFAPSCAARRAIASPMPRLPPDISDRPSAQRLLLGAHRRGMMTGSSGCARRTRARWVSRAAPVPAAAGRDRTPRAAHPGARPGLASVERGRACGRAARGSAAAGSPTLSERRRAVALGQPRPVGARARARRGRSAAPPAPSHRASKI